MASKYTAINQTEDDIDDGEQTLLIPNKLIITFFVNTGFAIIIPSLWPFLDDGYHSPKWILGWVVAAYSAGQFVISPLMGWWANRRPVREVLIVSLLLGVGGNILYCWSPNQWVVLAARAIVGMGAGNVGVCRAYAAHATTAKDRTAFMANLSAAQTFGFVVGPAIGAALSYINFSMGPIVVNEYFAPAYLSAILNFISIIPLIWFREVPFHQGEEEAAALGSEFQAKPSKVAVVSIILSFSICISEFAVLETVAVPFTGELYNWSVARNGWVFAGAGVLSVIVFIVLRPISRRVSDRLLLLLGFVIMTPGFGVLIAYPDPNMAQWRFYFGVAIICIGYPITAVITYAIFSKVLGPMAQGTMMGWLTGFGSLARMVGPIWSSAMLDNVSAASVWLVCALLALAGALLNAATWRWLVPHAYLLLKEEQE